METDAKEIICYTKSFSKSLDEYIDTYQKYVTTLSEDIINNKGDTLDKLKACVFEISEINESLLLLKSYSNTLMDFANKL